MTLAVPQRRVAADRLRGREGLVAELTGKVRQRTGGDTRVPGVWLLSGMGGCGKTTVALEMAHRLVDSSTRVWWVSGADGEGLTGALRAVAFAAGAEATDFVGVHPADVLWKRLDALTFPWLLVLDNVDDPAILASASARTAEGVGWLREPARTWGAVLITSRESRAERWGAWVHVVDVGLLSKDDGAEVLRDLAPQAGSVQEARELAEHLGGLPLALNLAGSYLARALEEPWPSPSTPNTFAAYRRSFDTRLAEVAADPDADLRSADRARRAILSTWELSLDLLHRQGSDLARPLLRLLAAFGHAQIPYQELFDPENLARSGLFIDPNQSRINTALKGLAGLQLITIGMARDGEFLDGPGGGSLRWITLHPMVRTATRAHTDFAEQAPLLLTLITTLLQRFISTLVERSPDDWARWRIIAPHCFAARMLLEECGPRVDTDTALIAAATEPAFRAARYHVYLGMYGEAVSELGSVAEARKRLLGEEDPATISARVQLSWALRENGDLDEADRLYEDVCRACERTLVDGHPYLQSAKVGRAHVLRELGRYEAAETELRAALAMRRRDPRTDQRDILNIRRDLAILAHKRGRIEEAVTELRDVRQQYRALAGAGDLGTFSAAVSLVMALRDAGHTDEAETVAEGLVGDLRTVLSDDHPAVLHARHERARLIRDHESDRGCLERARDEFTDIWRISEHRFGADHPHTIAARHELATVWHLLGWPEEAAEHYRAALEAGHRRLGEHRPDIMLCAHNLATVLAELADHRGARMDGTQPHQDPLTAASPDLTGITLEQALSNEQASSVHHDAAQLLNRFVHSRRSRGGPNQPPPPGFSTGVYGGSGVPGERSVHYRPAIHTTGPALRPFPSATDVRLVAVGAEDRTLVQRLRAQQRGVRAVALGELLRLLRPEDTLTPDGASGLPKIGEVKELLLRAEHANAVAVGDVLLLPSVGRWLSHTLRALNTELSGPRTGADNSSPHLPYLATVAATAGVRAKINFTLSVPLYDGLAVLPGLGAADFRTTAATTAQVTRGDGAALIRCSEVVVRLPIPSEPLPKGWLPLWRVAPEGRSHFDLVLDDTDPYREVDGPMPPRRLDPMDVTRWQEAIQSAGARLTDVVGPDQYEALTAGLTTLTPRPGSDGGMMTSISSSDAFGGAVLSAPPDAVELAVTLVHEFRHMNLNAVLDSLDLYHDQAEGPEEFYYAPWRDDPRPLPGFFHGVFAFLGVVEFWCQLAQSTAAADTLRRRVQFQLLYWRTQTQDAYEALGSTQHLTKAGREFIARMGVGLARTTHPKAMPDEVKALAEEAVIAHRVRWRLHHLHPDLNAVTDLAKAWASGAPRPPASHIPCLLLPDSAVPSLNDYTALLCRMAADPSRLADDAFAPSDLARFRGDTDSARRLATDRIAHQPQRHQPWCQLALALRKSSTTGPPGTAPAARAVTHRPEVVRAVHARATTLTEAFPDPTALAAWVGLLDSAGDHAQLPRMYPLP